MLILGNERVTEVLLKYGSDVNSEDTAGVTPIFYAVSNGNQGVRAVLATIELSDSFSKKKAQEALLKHFTQPLHNDSGEKIVKLFLNNGANINHKMKNGNTPFKQSDDFGKIQ